MPIDGPMATLTLEMLAMPQFCTRGCRRGRRCRWQSAADGVPFCLGGLDAHQRQCFDELYQMVELAEDPTALLDRYNADPQFDRALVQAAVAISRAGRGVWSDPGLRSAGSSIAAVNVPGAEPPGPPRRGRRGARRRVRRPIARDAMPTTACKTGN
ncbi:hypothetical protein J2Z17_003346 [Rhizobium halophytocola]|uniref:Uncharacterized protein n=1 Tax=Rhizobium halophytocola TaxID=735519 RepID=A0ABS4E1R7_9HYPH|nr:hypothetical protein [Rhizobium halophytocola]